MSSLTTTTAAQKRSAAAGRNYKFRNRGLRDGLRALYEDGDVISRADAVAAMVALGFDEGPAGRELTLLATTAFELRQCPGMPERFVRREAVSSARESGDVFAFERLTIAHHDPMAAWRLCSRDPMTDERRAALSHKGSA